MKFEILSDPKNLKVVRSKIKEAIGTFKFKNVDEFNIIFSVDEAVQNIIRYAYNFDKTKKIMFDVELIDIDLVIKIRDFGKQVDLSKIKSRDLDDVKPGGLGVHFIKSICKHVNYSHVDDPNGGTELVLVF